ncbi:MAG: hypothetical protein JWR25_1168 [Noviherbaspirillum sp.]|nr:hypothetical protein [Noviherbaspirillum sp.]
MDSNENFVDRRVLPDRRIRRRRRRTYRDPDLPVAGIFAVIVLAMVASASMMAFFTWYSRAVCGM